MISITKYLNLKLTTRLPPLRRATRGISDDFNIQISNIQVIFDIINISIFMSNVLKILIVTYDYGYEKNLYFLVECLFNIYFFHKHVE